LLGASFPSFLNGAKNAKWGTPTGGFFVFVSPGGFFVKKEEKLRFLGRCRPAGGESLASTDLQKKPRGARPPSAVPRPKRVPPFLVYKRIQMAGLGCTIRVRPSMPARSARHPPTVAERLCDAKLARIHVASPATKPYAAWVHAAWRFTTLLRSSARSCAKHRCTRKVIG
jgi:hypothetical protein